MDDRTAAGIAALEGQLELARARADKLESELETERKAKQRMENRAFNLESERSALEAELLAIAEAAGYVNRAEGQDGYERMSGQELAERWKEDRREKESLVGQLEAALDTLETCRLVACHEDVTEIVGVFFAERDANR